MVSIHAPARGATSGCFIQRAVKPRPSGRGYKAHLNADHNAALNILAAGQAVSACGAGRAQAPVLNQEPAYGAAR